MGVARAEGPLIDAVRAAYDSDALFDPTARAALTDQRTALRNPIRRRLNAGFFGLVDHHVHHVLGERNARLFADLPMSFPR